MCDGEYCNEYNEGYAHGNREGYAEGKKDAREKVCADLCPQCAGNDRTFSAAVLHDGVWVHFRKLSSNAQGSAMCAAGRLQTLLM